MHRSSARFLPTPVCAIALLGVALAACKSPGGGTAENSEAGRIRTMPAELPTEPTYASANAPSTGDTAEYTVLMSGRVSGHMRQWPDTNSTVTTKFAFNDRGRGPDVTQTLKLDKAGLPVGMQLVGTNYLKVPIREQVQLAPGPLLTWRNENAAGRTTPGRGFYLPLQEVPSDLAFVARAALRTKTKTVNVLPEGTARVVVGTSLTVSGGDRTMTVTLHEISGLGLTPQPIWLDAEGRLFASGATWWMVIRSGFESSVDALVAAQSAAEQQRTRAIASRLGRTPAGYVVIVHANLFDAVARKMKPAQMIIVRGDRIEAVGDDGTLPIPQGAEVIDAGNRTLLPGLWDMHVHVSDEDGLLHIAAGVTSVRDLANDTDELIARRERFDSGAVIGPRIAMAGFIDGPGPYAGPTKVLVSTRDAARAAVEAYANRGYEQVKVYSSLDPSLLPTIVRTAHDRGLRVSGHVPNGMTAEQMVRAGADELQHANFLFLNFLGDSGIDTRTPARFTSVAKLAGSIDVRSERVQRFIALLKERDVVVDPTLNVFEQMFTARAGTYSEAAMPVATRVPPVARRSLIGGGLPMTPSQEETYRASFINMERLVRRMHEAGVRLVAGTDAMAGFSFHRELELFSEAGIPNTEILYIATLGAARVMKKDADRGSLEAGKIADLVIVDGDPSQRMRDIRRAEMVMKGGVIYVPDSLYATMAIKPAPRKGAIPMREVSAADVVCRGRAAVVKKGEKAPMNCRVVDAPVTPAKRPVRRAAPRTRRPAATTPKPVTPPTTTSKP
ncbi:MAG TPA: amidohydrolase family protein [Gemmatimonadaceae bacterium]|nr:amidohydrolase family protein [Gemmatimonadaceae bacterium]